MSPDAGKPIAALVAGEQQLEMLAAVNEALDAAVDLAQPHRTAAHCLTAHAMLAIALEHPGRAGWAADRLRRLAHEWRAER